MRKLVTIEQILDIQPIPDADAIEKVRVRGWWVVVAKSSNFKVNDRVLYHEIDSFLPVTPAYDFLLKGSSPKKMLFEGNEVEGIRLKTVKLRGCVSQGLVLPIPETLSHLEIGCDVSELLNVLKYEPPIPPQLAGTIKGAFPGFLRKTDEERCLEENTIIETENGEKSIKEICETKYGGKTKSFNIETKETSWENIKDHFVARNYGGWLEIILEDDTKLICTNNHYIWLPEFNCYRTAQELNVGDMLLKDR